MLGDPVAHSLSPLLHRTAMARLGIPGDYRARSVDTAGLGDAIAEIRNGDLDGANVTMPHKTLAARLADRQTADVRRTGAANTLVRVGDAVWAHNTDIPGIGHAWKWGELPGASPVLVLGAGGAAAAALVALEGRPLFVAARDGDAAAGLIARLGVDAAAHPWGRALPGAVVVNATPLGMRGDRLPTELLDSATGLLDMTYGAGDTAATAAMRRRHLPVADGADMLLGQAIESFRLWTGRNAPVAAMRTALRRVHPSAPVPPAAPPSGSPPPSGDRLPSVPDLS